MKTLKLAVFNQKKTIFLYLIWFLLYFSIGSNYYNEIGYIIENFKGNFYNLIKFDLFRSLSVLIGFFFFNYFLF
mgnify:CR=1 FL=1